MPIKNWFYLRKDTTIKVDTITSPSDTYVPIAAVDSPPTCNIISVENLKSSIYGYDKFVGIISQLTTSNPIISNVLENTLGSPSTSRIGVGEYTITLPGLSVATYYGDVVVFVTNGTGLTPGGYVEAIYGGSGYVTLKTYNSSGVLSDSVLASCSIEIRYYS